MELPGGKEQQIPVIVINDLYKDWKGKVRLRVLRGGKTLSEKVPSCRVKALGETRVSFACSIPSGPGEYQLEAALLGGDSKPVCSLRDFRIGAAGNKEDAGIARGKAIQASSTYVEEGHDYRPRDIRMAEAQFARRAHHPVGHFSVVFMVQALSRRAGGWRSSGRRDGDDCLMMDIRVARVQLRR